MSFVEPESPVKKVPNRPKVSIMVDEAIKTLGESKGASLYAIKKYISSKYSIDAEKLSTRIKKYLKAAVESGDLIQPTGKGANGSFKINEQKVKAKPKDSKLSLLKPVEPNVPNLKKTSPKKSPTKLQSRFKLYVSTPKRTLKPKKRFAKFPDESPVKKIEDSDAQMEPATDTTFINPKATRDKKPKVSFATRPRKSLAWELSRKSQSLQETSTTAPKLKKKDAAENPATDNRFINPKATRDKKPRVSFPTKPRKSLASGSQNIKTKESSKNSLFLQETSTTPPKLEKKDSAKSIKTKKGPKPGKSEKSQPIKQLLKIKSEVQMANLQQC